MPTVQANGLELYYTERGEGPPLLLIAGLGADHRAWTPIAASLAGRFRCITFDNRDAGRSQRAAGPYTTRDMADDAACLLDGLGVDRADIVGWSMGGMIAQELAINFPERVRRLALTATYTSGDPRGSAIFAAHAMLRRTMSREDYCRATFWSVYSHQDYRREGFIETAIARAAADDLWQPQDAYERQVQATTTACTEGRLHLIAAPTLILAGSDDILAPMRFQDVLRRDIADNRFELIEGAAHGLIWSHPDAVSDQLARFFTE